MPEENSIQCLEANTVGPAAAVVNKKINHEISCIERKVRGLWI